MTKPTKTQANRERSRSKVAGVLRTKGHPSGRPPAGKELHHIKPVAEGGKTTNKNTVVVTKAEHKKIHANNRKKGRI